MHFEVQLLVHLKTRSYWFKNIALNALRNVLFSSLFSSLFYSLFYALFCSLTKPLKTARCLFFPKLSHSLKHSPLRRLSNWALQGKKKSNNKQFFLLHLPCESKKKSPGFVSLLCTQLTTLINVHIFRSYTTQQRKQRPRWASTHLQTMKLTSFSFPVCERSVIAVYCCRYRLKQQRRRKENRRLCCFGR